jgi:hypothetical protein
MPSLSSLIPAQLEVNQPDVRIEWVALIESHLLGTPVSLGNLVCPQKTGWLQKLFWLPCDAKDGRERPHVEARNRWTIAMNVAATSRIRSKLPLAIALGSTSELPTPRQHAPALKNASAVVRSTPPVGISRI